MRSTELRDIIAERVASGYRYRGWKMPPDTVRLMSDALKDADGEEEMVAALKGVVKQVMTPPSERRFCRHLTTWSSFH